MQEPSKQCIDPAQTGYGGLPDEEVQKIRGRVDKICQRTGKEPYEALADVVYKKFVLKSCVVQIKESLNHNQTLKKQKFNRSVEEIYKSGYMTGCTDYALVYGALANQMGIPTNFLATKENGEKGRAAKEGHVFLGHAFCEVWDAKNNIWALVDPTNRKVQKGYDPEKPFEIKHKVYGSDKYKPYFRGDISEIFEGVNFEDRNKRYIEYAEHADESERGNVITLVNRSDNPERSDTTTLVNRAELKVEEPEEEPEIEDGIERVRTRGDGFDDLH